MKPSSEAILSPSRFLNLTIFTLITIYALFTGWMISRGGMGDPVGGDFRPFLASAQIARTSGYASIYNSRTQEEVQEALISRYRTGDIDVLPVFFLPVFIIPFQPFLLVGFPASFGIWTLMNLGLLILFVRRFARGNSLLPVLGLLLASYPVFANFLWGQVNIWLLWCITGFLEAWETGKPFRGGLWLGGLLIKPQTLVWLIPALALSREWKILAGFGVTALGLLLVSLLLAGPEGMLAWLRLPLQYVGESPAIVPEAMMNVRVLSKMLALVLPSAWA